MFILKERTRAFLLNLEFVKSVVYWRSLLLSNLEGRPLR